jgi:hypothetical protein
MDPILRKKVNAKFVVRFTYHHSGKTILVGFGQLHKKIGMDGIKQATEAANEALNQDENTFTKEVEGRFKITFNKR